MADMEKHEAFTKWAISQGVKLNGVAAHRFPGRGLGIVATEAITPNKILITVPTTALRTRTTVSKSISALLPGITTHGLLAADLALDLLDPSSPRAPWHAVLPSNQDFKDTLPFLWPTTLQALLPPAAAKLLQNQNLKFAKDWAQVSSAFPSLARESYLYCWCLVNTRTFYYTPPSKSKLQKRTNPNENMALNPFADYFNHSSRGSGVSFSSQGFSITSTQTVEVGEEVYISYGKHSNDFLLAEYGFVMADNLWDDVSLDTVILPALTAEKKELLRENGFLGRYVLDKEGPCYRAQVAVRAMCMGERRWMGFISGVVEEGDGDGEWKVVMRRLLGVLREDARGRIGGLEGLRDGEEGQREMLGRRWRQIVELVDRGAECL